jgi:hypothetical protein
VKRRDFITLLGCAAVARPRAARPQQPVLPANGFFISPPHQAAANAWQRFRCVSARPAKFRFPSKCSNLVSAANVRGPIASFWRCPRS